MLLSGSDPSVSTRLHRDPEGSGGSAEGAGPEQRSGLPGSCELSACGAANSAPHGDQRLVAPTLRLLILEIILLFDQDETNSTAFNL